VTPNTDAAYAKVVKSLEMRGRFPKEAPNLNKMKSALKRSGFILDPRKVVVVGGTNGKGSVCAYLAALLNFHKKKVGVYTSPHLLRTSERIKIDGQEITPQEFLDYNHRLGPTIEEFQLSHFEALTLIASHHFQNSGLDFAIFEIGLGGRWDACNAISHNWSVLTNIGSDHLEFLGPTLCDVAQNKVEIASKETTLICGTQMFSDPEVSSVVERHCRSNNIQLVKTCAPVFRINEGDSLPLYELQHADRYWPLALPGKRSAENAHLAVSVCEILIGEPLHDLSCFKGVQWQGRFSRLNVSSSPCPIYLSGDHNPEGLDSLLEILSHTRYEKIHILFAVSNDKPFEKLFSQLRSVPRSVLYLTETSFKSRKIEEWPKQYLSSTSFCSASSIKALKACIAAADREDIVLVTGSLYLVGDLLSACQEA